MLIILILINILSSKIFVFSLQSINYNNNHNHVERIAFGSCNNPNSQSLWSKIEEFKPSRLILLGDNMYADKKETTFKNQISTISIIETQYNLIKEDLGWKKLFHYLGGWNKIDVTYDDHDYGINNGAKNFHLKDPSQVAFWNFIEETNIEKLNQDSVYSSKKVKIKTKNNKQLIYKVIMIDTRSNKDKKGSSDGDFLGIEQWNWLEKEILDDKEVDLILLGSSIQLLVNDKFIEESWGEFPLARERLIQLLLKSQVPNTVILSGDVSLYLIYLFNIYLFNYYIIFIIKLDSCS
jgi:alkaline phosphatase D